MEETADFQWKGTCGEYEVFVAYAGEGPTQEEAYALFQEACRSTLYRNLAQLAQEDAARQAEKKKEGML